MKVLTGCADAVVLSCVLAASCASSEVAPNAPRRPARPEDCPVQLFPTTPPSYPTVDLQSVQVVCNRALGRVPCVEKLRIKTCAVGGDTAYGFKEGINPDGAGMFISATVAARGDAPPARTSAGAAPADDAGAGCAPICSPGFSCQAGQCIPQCNPSCEPTEICNRHRICEPAAAPPAPTK
jgi:hypothetical protein